MIVFFVILVSITSYLCDFDLDEDVIPTINISSMSRSSSFSSSSTGTAFSSAMAHTTWTNKPKDDLNCKGYRNATYKECPNLCKSICSNPGACKCFCKKEYRRNDSDICVPVASYSTEDSEF